MRGWPGHSREHALAARGISSRRTCVARGKEYDICGVLIDEEKFAEDLMSVRGPKMRPEDRELWLDYARERLEKFQEACGKDRVVLYRVVWLKDTTDLNVGNLGYSYTFGRDDLDMDVIEYLFNNADGKLWPQGEMDLEKDMKILVVGTEGENIDVEGSIFLNTEWPFEREVTVKRPKNVELLGVIE